MFASLSLNSPMVKGISKMALGASLFGMVMALDGMDLIPSDTYGKVTKYAGLTAGVIYMARGLTNFMVGE